MIFSNNPSIEKYICTALSEIESTKSPLTVRSVLIDAASSNLSHYEFSIILDAVHTYFSVRGFICNGMFDSSVYACQSCIYSGRCKIDSEVENL